jgi:son of sevenless-like protein
MTEVGHNETLIEMKDYPDVPEPENKGENKVAPGYDANEPKQERIEISEFSAPQQVPVQTTKVDIEVKSEPMASPDVKKPVRSEPVKVVKKMPQVVVIEDAQAYYPIPISSLTYREDPQDAAMWIDDNGKRTIECSTLNKLIEELTSPTSFDQYFCHTFMITFRSFTERDTLFDKLSERFNIPPPVGISKEDFAKFKTEKLDKIRLRVSSTFKFWIETFYAYDFDEEMNEKINELVEMMKSCKDGEKYANIVTRSLQKVKDEKQTNQGNVKYPEIMKISGGLFGKTKIRNKTLQWPSMEIARQITLVDFEYFKAIEPKECLNNAWNKQNRAAHAPNIANMINYFNDLSNWIASIILQTFDLTERKTILEKFIDVAEKLYELNNFNCVFALCSGLSLTSVYRLKKTWNAIEEEYKQKYVKLHRTISRDKNFAEIRTKIKNVKPPCIPYIGLYLTDLTFIEEDNAKYVNGKINFVKCQHFAGVIRDMQTYQNTKYIYQEVPEIKEALTNMVLLNDQEQGDKSFNLEPKETKKK